MKSSVAGEEVPAAFILYISFIIYLLKFFIYLYFVLMNSYGSHSSDFPFQQGTPLAERKKSMSLFPFDRTMDYLNRFSQQQKKNPVPRCNIKFPCEVQYIV